jgi:octaprenyl-diphosphate synthase
MGVTFQIRDDVLGLVGDKELGKPVGGDIREKKVTLLVIHALRTLGNKRLKAFYKPRTRASNREVERITELLKGSGAIDYASKRAGEFASKAKSPLEVLPNSDAKKALLELADFAIERNF